MRNQRSKIQSAAPSAEITGAGAELLGELRDLIESCRGRLARSVNRELVLLYWRIGTRLAKEVLGGERAGYGGKLSLHCRDNCRTSTGSALVARIYSI